MIGRLMGSCSLVRSKAPAFSAKAVIDGKITTVSSSDLIGKYWVLIFYPLDFTFVCPTEVSAFSERLDEFKKIGCDVLAASVDSEHCHLAFSKTARQNGGLQGVKIPLLADVTKSISKDYGVLLEDAGVALRATFVVDREGVVRHVTINDLQLGRSVDETLRIVQAVKFADAHGDVCPVNWRPGQRSMKPTAESAAEYFSQDEGQR